ncbi:glutathione S-transferase family protein [Azospirillum sp.]|uniref:glutathione S-transferase family protein n=1 Tax=Azospirillum sp. TaxID=34012 RepID=UPI003D725CD9
MITLYTSPTPNGHKASILLEELGLKYRVHRLDLAAGETKSPEYLKISPIGKMPAIVEELPGGVQRRLFGSGAILMHFAEHTGRLLPQGEARGEALSWMMLGISDLGPTAMDMFRFSVRAPEKIPYAIDLFKGELLRCYQALDNRLAEEEYLAGEYSIADISCFTFIAVAATMGGRLLERYPHVKRWHDAIIARPAVQRGLAVPE